MSVSIRCIIDACRVHRNAVSEEDDQGQKRDEDRKSQRCEPTIEDEVRGRNKEGRGAQKCEIDK